MFALNESKNNHSFFDNVLRKILCYNYTLKVPDYLLHAFLFFFSTKKIDTPRTKLSAHLNCNASNVRGAGHVTLIFFPEIANFPPPYLQV